MEQAVAFLALGWLIGGTILMVGSVRRGRELSETLASRHPDVYEALGRPRPGLLQSVRGDRFARFVARREYERLDDPVLAEQFDAYRRAEARLVISLLASMGVVFLLVVWVRGTV